jgi:hypothetical protein
MIGRMTLCIDGKVLPPIVIFRQGPRPSGVARDA